MQELIQVFENTEFGKVRTIIIDGEPWLVGKDVAMALGYKYPPDALKKHVDKKDKLTRRFADSGQNREMFVINESGLYSLILGSKLPSAKAFKRWVTHDVLPSIRKHGLYATEELLDNPDLAIAVFAKFKEEREKNKQLKAEIADMKPKATYHDLVLSCPEVVPISVIAQDYGLSARRMNALLHKLGVQYKKGNLWYLYNTYSGKGYTQSKTYATEEVDGEKHAHVHMYWTQKGRFFLYELLREHGILPVIEQEALSA